MIHEQLCDLVALRNNISHKFRKVFQKYDKNLSFFHWVSSTPLPISVEKSSFITGFCIFLNSSFSLDRFSEQLEEDLFTSLENIHCDEARFQIRLSQIRMNSSPNFDHPPPVSLFHIHNRLFYENQIFHRLRIIVEKAKDHKRRVEENILTLLMNLPAQYRNITFHWYEQDMIDPEDKEDILLLKQKRDEFFWPNEEWNVTRIFTCICVCVSISKQFWKYSQFIFSIVAHTINLEIRGNNSISSKN